VKFTLFRRIIYKNRLITGILERYEQKSFIRHRSQNILKSGHV
jgi:hypothetical protein